MTAPPFAGQPDLASRAVGGSVVAASDDLFAERENLIKPEAPRHDAHTFGHKGQVYDGWETRRHREPGNDWALVRLGIPGVISGVVVDTAFFTGNFPPEVSVEATGVEGYPSVEELLAAEWETILPRSAVKGDALNPFEVSSGRRFTHVRLTIYPDGGVARLRVHGSPVPDPRQLAAAELDLGALVNGASISGCSNMFYSSPTNLIAPGEARTMGGGWETARRRDGGNDWVEIELAGPGVLRQAEIDTSYFLGNSPGWASLTGRTPDGSSIELLPRTRLQPDTVHRLRLDAHPAVSRVRIDVFPDGGLARLRLHGTLTTAARAVLAVDWFNRLPASQASVISEVERPISSVESLPAALRAELGC